MKKSSVKAKNDDKKPYAEVVSERIIEALKAGCAPWQKVWEPGRPGAGMPMNPTTQKPYHGINSLILMMSGYPDNRWMTFKQAAALGANVRKGEKGTAIQYWSFQARINKKDDNGRDVLGDDGKPQKVTVRLSKPRVFTATVFNVAQIDNLPESILNSEGAPQETWDSIADIERIIAASNADIEHVEGDRAYYSPGQDKIRMPLRGQFTAAVDYYRVLTHELGHWTGHGTRLNRDLTGSFGSESYAREELRAEIASMMIGDKLGLGHDPSNHIAYVKSWIKILEEDPLEIFRAASDADKIQSFLLSLDRKLEADEEFEPEEESNGLGM